MLAVLIFILSGVVIARTPILEDEAQQQAEAVASAKHNLDLFTDRYVGGRDNFLQVTTAQTNYLDNERNEVEIWRRRMKASVLLVKALGGGWNADAGMKREQAAADAQAGSGATEQQAKAT